MADIVNEQGKEPEVSKEDMEKLESVKKADAAVKSMHDFTSPEVLYNELIASIKKYHPSTDITMIQKAYETAREAHKDQKRKSGEPYIIHPLCVAIILADLELDKETIVAGLLHDAVEDTWMTCDEITREFGPEVALLVDGVTKIGQLSYSKDKVELQAESLRKMFLAMAKDIRVILIKLADRLHNMRTLQYMTPEKQKEKARETMDIYAPIAQRLGISKIKVELDDLSLKYLKPDVYYDLVEKVALRKSVREEFVGNIVKTVHQHMVEAGIKAQVDGRVKHFFSIYKKMVNQNKTIDQIYDLFAVRILVDTVKDCYAALGVIHEMYKPIPGRFKDYIAMPKPNMYQSLHTTLIGPNGQPFEIQIRTFEMHKTAEYGIAAHWKYKEASDGKASSGNREEEKLNWLRQILEWQRDMSDNKEFMSLLKNDLDLFADSVYCFTPQGDVKTLPNGSTPIDFAYSVHSAVGNKMVGARVNGKLVPIEYRIQNGDRIEIITSQNSQGPSRDWLKVVKSTQAKNKINQWFKKELKEDNILKGKEMLAQYAKSKQVSLMLWYNSNGFENDAPQTPRQIMNNSIARKKEMAWMKKIGVVGIKVDFFGGDKQETMKLYEVILSDANDYGLEVIFHGCTMPRGWERMYPNYVSSEAALASENVYFMDYHAKKEAFEMTMHPFSRNAVASFDWGGVMMNKYLSRDNKSRHQRYTSDIFEMATAITNQSSVNCVCLYPNNLQDVPQWELDWLKGLPTAWDDVKFIAGYPTRYAVIARKASQENGSGAAVNNGKWIVGGLNATDKPLTLTLNLPMFAGKTVEYLTDQPKKQGEKFYTSVKKTLKVGKNGKAKVVIQPNGGIIIN